MQVLAPFGALLAALISDRYNRKWSITVVALLTAACGFAYGFSAEVAGIIIFGALMILFFQCFAPMLYAYTAECFPTRSGARAPDSRTAWDAWRMPSDRSRSHICSPTTAIMSVFLYIGACWVGVALAIGLFGPLTKGRAL